MKTVSLELSKELKVNGYPQEDSKIYWITREDEADPIPIYFGHDMKRLKYYQEEDEYRVFASPTADEILDWLPYKICGRNKIDFNLYIWKREETWGIGYYEDEKRKLQIHIIVLNSLADAAAKMWLYLKNNNLF